MDNKLFASTLVKSSLSIFSYAILLFVLFLLGFGFHSVGYQQGYQQGYQKGYQKGYIEGVKYACTECENVVKQTIAEYKLPEEAK
jgi:hypothetical protein